MRAGLILVAIVVMAAFAAGVGRGDYAGLSAAPARLSAVGQAQEDALEVTEVILANDVTGCEDYEENVDGTFARGQRAYFLMLARGSQAEQVGTEYRHLLAVPSFTMMDEQGEPFLEVGDLGTIEISSPDADSEVCLWVWADIQQDYPVGEATVQIAVTDQIGGQQTTVETQFTIVEGDQASPTAVGTLPPGLTAVPTPDGALTPMPNATPLPGGAPTPTPGATPVPEEAGEVTIGGEAEGEIEAGGAVAYSVELEEGRVYVFQTRLGTLTDPVLLLRGPDGAELAFDDDSGPGRAARILWRAAESGRHALIVGGFANEAGTFIVEATTFEQFIEGAQPIAVGEQLSGELGEGESDLYVVELEGGTSYVMGVGLDTLPDSVMKLMSRDGRVLAENDDIDDTRASRIEWTAAESGPHYIEVDSYDGRPGSYAIAVIEAGADQGAAEPEQPPSEENAGDVTQT